VLLGALNLVAAAGLYYGIWWQVDPELRLRVLIHMPLPGVDIDQAAKALGPGGVQSPSRSVGASDAARDIRAQTAQAAWFVGTIVGWEALATASICALALSGGALLAKGGGSRIRAGGIAFGLVALLLFAWQAYALWKQYGRVVPDQIRVDVGVIVLLAALIGLGVARSVRGLTYLGAIMLIISACGTAFAVYVGTAYDALKLEELPLPLLPSLVLVFVMHSLWGWVLLALAPRIDERLSPRLTIR
jgi:hypothetical protein